MKIIEPNISDDTFFQEIKKAIYENKPFGMVRLGDGEARILKNRMIIAEKVRRNWFHDGITNGEMFKLFNNMLYNTVLNADAVGVYPFTPFLNDIKRIFGFDNINEAHKKALSMFGNPSNYHIPVYNLPQISGKTVFDAGMFRREKYGSIYRYRELFQSKPIHIISCRTEQLQNNNIDQVLGCEVSFTQIPRSIRFTEIEKQIQIEKIPESVVVFATGGGGKWITAKAKTLGKIILDLGSVVDGWAGIETRSGPLTDIRKHLLVQNGIPYIKPLTEEP